MTAATERATPVEPVIPGDDRDTYWVECCMRPGADLAAFYEAVRGSGALASHHFYFEPWHPEGAVVRLRFASGWDGWLRIKSHPDVERVYRWDAGPDRELFGDDWPLVRAFFEASSRLAASGLDPWRLHKITHCHLNAHGLNVKDEVRFSARYFRERVRVWWRYRREDWMKASVR